VAQVTLSEDQISCDNDWVRGEIEQIWAVQPHTPYDPEALWTLGDMAKSRMAARIIKKIYPGFVGAAPPDVTL
jgi:hypothetical protein